MIVAITAKCKRDAKRRARKCRKYLQYSKVLSVKFDRKECKYWNVYIVEFKIKY